MENTYLLASTGTPDISENIKPLYRIIKPMFIGNQEGIGVLIASV